MSSESDTNCSSVYCTSVLNFNFGCKLIDQMLKIFTLQQYPSSDVYWHYHHGTHILLLGLAFTVVEVSGYVESIALVTQWVAGNVIILNSGIAWNVGLLQPLGEIPPNRNKWLVSDIWSKGQFEVGIE